MKGTPIDREGAWGEGVRGAGPVRAHRGECGAPRLSGGGADRELELLVSQLPALDADDPEREEVAAVRAAILQLVTEIKIGLVDRP